MLNDPIVNDPPSKPRKKARIIVETHFRVNYEDHYYLIVPDIAAGCRGRYTVYRIPSSPSRRIKVIGRELPLGHARRIARED